MSFINEMAIFPRKYSVALIKHLEKRKAEAPFKYWLENHLKKGDILPRGRFFKGKNGGKRHLIFEEFYLSEFETPPRKDVYPRIG